MPSIVSPAKIACLDFDLRKLRVRMGVQMLLNDPNDLERILLLEADNVKERINKILVAGANIILTTKGIDDLALKYFVEARAIACRRVPREDMRRIARVTGAIFINTLADADGNESFDSCQLGNADIVLEDNLGGDEIIVFKNCEENGFVTILLRGPNHLMLEEMERSLNDVFCVIKKVLEGGTVVPGGGAVESALPILLEDFAITLGSREQIAIAEFADALLIIPKTLAVNAAKDATELVAKLRSHHYVSRLQDFRNSFHHTPFGLDLVNGAIRNNLEAGVVEPAISKIKMIQFATEAAITIFRIDDLIKFDTRKDDSST
jgi:T-complex protein 1 subunit alpha